MFKRYQGSTGIRSAAGCLCVAWMLALFGLVSPYWIVRSNYYYTGGPWSFGLAGSTYAIGPYLASYTSGSIPCYCGIWTCSCTFVSQWNYFSTFTGNNDICSNSISVQIGLTTSDTLYNLVGQYGWCDSAGSTPHIPKQNNVTWQVATAAVCLLFAATICAFAAPNYGRSKIAIFGSVCAFVGCALTLTSICVASTSPYNKHYLNEGGYLPVQNGTGMTVAGPVSMYWGAGFYTMIIAFVCSFVAAIYIAASARSLDDEMEYGNTQYPTYNDGVQMNQVPAQQVVYTTQPQVVYTTQPVTAYPANY